MWQPCVGGKKGNIVLLTEIAVLLDIVDCKKRKVYFRMNPYQIEKWLRTTSNAHMWELGIWSACGATRCRSLRLACFYWHSFRWNGCHHQQTDFCRSVDRIKNRFSAGALLTTFSIHRYQCNAIHHASMPSICDTWYTWPRSNVFTNFMWLNEFVQTQTACHGIKIKVASKLASLSWKSSLLFQMIINWNSYINITLYITRLKA